MSSSKITNVPHFLVARSPMGLRNAMLKNNIKHGLIFDYYQIIFDGKNWIAWFQLDAVDSMQEEIREAEAKGTS